MPAKKPTFFAVKNDNQFLALQEHSNREIRELATQAEKHRSALFLAKSAKLVYGQQKNVAENGEPPHSMTSKH